MMPCGIEELCHHSFIFSTQPLAIFIIYLSIYLFVCLFLLFIYSFIYSFIYLLIHPQEQILVKLESEYKEFLSWNKMHWEMSSANCQPFFLASNCQLCTCYQSWWPFLKAYSVEQNSTDLQIFAEIMIRMLLSIKSPCVCWWSGAIRLQTICNHNADK